MKLNIKNNSPYAHLEVAPIGGGQVNFHLVVGTDFLPLFNVKQARAIHSLLGQALDQIDRQEREAAEAAALAARQDIVEIDGVKVVCLRSVVDGAYTVAWPEGTTREAAPWVVGPSLHAKTRKWLIHGPVYQRWPHDTGNKRRVHPSNYVTLQAAVREAIRQEKAGTLPR